jgi:hypothetical protein
LFRIYILLICESKHLNRNIKIILQKKSRKWSSQCYSKSYLRSQMRAIILSIVYIFVVVKQQLRYICYLDQTREVDKHHDDRYHSK